MSHRAVKKRAGRECFMQRGNVNIKCQRRRTGVSAPHVTRGQPLASALVVDRELKPRIRRKQFRYFPQPLRHLRRRQQRIVALPQIVIVDVNKQRQQVNRNRVGKVAASTRSYASPRPGPRSRRFARLPRIQRGFAASPGLHLLPRQVSELL